MFNCLKYILFTILLFPIFLYSKSINFSQEEKAWLAKSPTITYSEVNWKPLSIIEDNRMKGIMGDYLDLVSKKTGIKFKFIASKSWPDVLEQFSAKKIDLVPGVGSSPQELALGSISSLYAKYPMVIVTNEQYKYLEGLKQLEGKTIAVPKYYTSYNFIVKNFPNLKLITTQNIPEALLLVENGKADAFVGHIATSLFYIAENHLSDLKISGKTSFVFEHHYLIQKDNALLLSIINKVFESISHHEKKVIYDKWIQTSVVEEKIDYTLLFFALGIFLLITFALMYREYLLKEHNKTISNANRDLKIIMDTTHEGIIISQDGVIIDLNKSALNIFGTKKENLIGVQVIDLIEDSFKEQVAKAFQEKEIEPYEIKIKLLDGNIIPAIVKGTNIKLEEKNVRISTFIDISQLKKQEQLLIEQSSMAAMGEMASTLAHQWRQPLAVINSTVGSWKFLDELGELDKKTILDGANIVTSKAEELSEVINNFIYLFESDNSKSEFFIDEIIEKLLKTEKPLLENNEITLINRVKTSKKINVNQKRCMQALFNVLHNSIEILEKKEQKRVIVLDAKSVDLNLEISIHDSGGGFKNKNINESFKPYYSTKDSLNGLGLGLYMTHTIIKKMNGEIQASNEDFILEGEKYFGAKVTLTIPYMK